MQNIPGIIVNPLVPREYNENIPCVRILRKKNEEKQHVFSLDFSQLRMHFSRVLGILPELAVIFKEILVFHLYNKRQKTMYAQAKKPYEHSSENSRVWDKNQYFT